MKVDDRLLLPGFEPKVLGNPTVVLVGLAVPLAPVVEPGGPDAQPSGEPPGADLGLLRPAPDEIHDLVPRIFGTHTPVRVPQVFFRATCSAVSSARTSSLVWI